MASITKRKDSYRISVSCGYDSSNKKILKTMTYTPAPGMTPKQIEKEVQRQAMIFEEKCKTGQVLDSNTKFDDFSKKWFEDYAEKQLKKTTVSRYHDLMKRITPAIGHIKLDKLQPHHLLEFYSNLEENGVRADIKYTPCNNFKEILNKKKMTYTQLSEKAKVSIATVKSCTTGKNVTCKSAELISKALKMDIIKLFTPCTDNSTLSAKTILHYHRLISAILTTAVQWRVIFSNPCDRVKPPKVDRIEAKYLDEVEAGNLLTVLENAPIQYKVIAKLLIYTGFRRAELCGLEWEDIDFKANTIRVQRNSLYLPSVGVFEDTTKNITSNRVIKVSNVAMEMLKEYKKYQQTERLKLGTKWINSNKVFTAWNGKAINPTTISSWFRKFVKKNDLPKICIHSLRHTNATLMIASGTPIKTVSNRLGHANVTTTGNIYTNAIRSADEEAADTLQDIFSPGKKSNSDIG